MGLPDPRDSQELAEFLRAKAEDFKQLSDKYEAAANAVEQASELQHDLREKLNSLDGARDILDAGYLKELLDGRVAATTRRRRGRERTIPVFKGQRGSRRLAPEEI